MEFGQGLQSFTQNQPPLLSVPEQFYITAMTSWTSETPILIPSMTQNYALFMWNSQNLSFSAAILNFVTWQSQPPLLSVPEQFYITAMTSWTSKTPILIPSMTQNYALFMWNSQNLSFSAAILNFVTWQNQPPLLSVPEQFYITAMTSWTSKTPILIPSMTQNYALFMWNSQNLSFSAAILNFVTWQQCPSFWEGPPSVFSYTCQVETISEAKPSSAKIGHGFLDFSSTIYDIHAFFYISNPFFRSASVLFGWFQPGLLLRCCLFLNKHWNILGREKRLVMKYACTVTDVMHRK